MTTYSDGYQTVHPDNREWLRDFEPILPWKVGSNFSVHRPRGLYFNKIIIKWYSNFHACDHILRTGALLLLPSISKWSMDLNHRPTLIRRGAGTSWYRFKKVIERLAGDGLEGCGCLLQLPEYGWGATNWITTAPIYCLPTVYWAIVLLRTINLMVHRDSELSISPAVCPVQSSTDQLVAGLFPWPGLIPDELPDSPIPADKTDWTWLDPPDGWPPLSQTV